MPCYNERDSLPKVVADIRAAMEGRDYTYEILVVDDRSTDGSPAAAERLGCRVLRSAMHKGPGAARKTGILAARGDIVVMLDADGTCEAKAIPRLLSFFPAFDQVNGARLDGNGAVPALRVPPQWFIRKLAGYLASVEIPDLNTSLKAFKRRQMLPYLWTIPDGVSCVSSMTMAFLCNGHPVKYIPVEYYRKAGGRLPNPLLDTCNDIVTVFRLITYFEPLRIFFPVAALLIAGGSLTPAMEALYGQYSLRIADATLIVLGVVTGLHGLLADMIVAQARTRAFVMRFRVERSVEEKE